MNLFSKVFEFWTWLHSFFRAASPQLSHDKIALQFAYQNNVLYTCCTMLWPFSTIDLLKKHKTVIVSYINVPYTCTIHVHENEEDKLGSRYTKFLPRMSRQCHYKARLEYSAISFINYRTLTSWSTTSIQHWHDQPATSGYGWVHIKVFFGDP
jgi:hypothetical protein